jgi:hypothetical protein
MILKFKCENNTLILYSDENNFSQRLFSVDPDNILCSQTPQQVLDSFLKIVGKYETISKYTYCEMPLIDIITAVARLFSKLTSGKCAGVKALIIGGGLDGTAVLLALTLKMFSDDNRLYIMNNWEVSASEPIAQYENMFEHYRAVLKMNEVDRQVIHLVCDPLSGMDALRDNYYDIIFINAADSFGVQKDIVNAVRTVRAGGLLIGYGCECKSDELPHEADNDSTKNQYHYGVIKALHEIFEDNFEHTPQNAVWSKTVSENDKKRLIFSCTTEEEKTALILCEDICGIFAEIKINDDLSGCYKQFLFAAEKANSLLNFLNSKFYNLNNRTVKSMTACLQSYITFICAAMDCGDTKTAEKYLIKIEQFCPEWKAAFFNEFGTTGAA